MTLELVSIGDLEDRWCYTRQGVHQFAKSRHFPPPCATINRGRQKVWHLADIELFERQHPEVLDEAAKQFKIRGYLITLRKAAKRAAEAEGESP
jgi:hypothetical protein